METLSTEAAKTPDGYYIWRTCEDEKVRASHAAHDWEIRAWKDSPDPHQEYNCRCWSDDATPEQIEKKKKQKCFDKEPWEEEAKENIRNFEKHKSWPYIDTKSKITVGYGTNIDSEAIFMNLPWRLEKEDGPKATQEQIKAAYDELTGQKTASENLDDLLDKNGKPVIGKGRKKKSFST